jgi:hypothetical protein
MKKIILAITMACAMNVYADYEDDVKAELKDPDSAQFKDVAGHEVEGAFIVCGRVNSKNGFGGYTGFKEFITVPGLTIIRGMEGITDEVFVGTWNRLCRN